MKNSINDFEWIAVDERMPKIFQHVLVANHSNPPTKAIFIEYEEGYYFCIGSDVKQTWKPQFWTPISKETYLSTIEEVHGEE